MEMGGSGARGDVQVPEGDSPPREHPPRGRASTVTKDGASKTDRNSTKDCSYFDVCTSASKDRTRPEAEAESRVR